MALAGDTARVEALANDLTRLYPHDTLVRFTYAPALHALVALARHHPAAAIDLLQANVPYERAVPATAYNFLFGAMYPVYVRGLAYAAGGQHAQAAAEFQKMLDNPGLLLCDPIGARARLERARALARAGRIDDARAAYKDVLALWKDADSDSTLVRLASAELKALG